MRGAGVSAWGRMPGAVPSAPPPAPCVLAVMDAFDNLADALPANELRELWRGARMIAAEGRKARLHLAQALQDPTHKSLDLLIRRNYLPASLLPCKGRRCQSRHSGCRRRRAAAAGPVHDGDGPSLTRRGLCFRRRGDSQFSSSPAGCVLPCPIVVGADAVPATAPVQEQRETEQQIRALLGQGWSLWAVQRELFRACEAVKANHSKVTVGTGGDTGGDTTI